MLDDARDYACGESSRIAYCKLEYFAMGRSSIVKVYWRKDVMAPSGIEKLEFQNFLSRSAFVCFLSPVRAGMRMKNPSNDTP